MLRIFVKDAVYALFCDENGIAIHFDRSLHGRIISRDERLSIPAGENDDVPFFQVMNRS
ncbi:hypothetical protein D3C71_2100960 [compost metagenome]